MREQKKGKKKARDGNHSKKTLNGTVLNTRDSYLSSNGKKASRHEKEYPQTNNDGLYRRIIVVGSNRHEELAIVEMESNKRKDSKIRTGEDRGYYRPIIHISFKDGSPLKKENKKLVKFKKNKNYTEVEARAVLNNSLKGCYVSKKQKKINRNLYRTMKKRGSLKNETIRLALLVWSQLQCFARTHPFQIPFWGTRLDIDIIYYSFCLSSHRRGLDKVSLPLMFLGQIFIFTPI